MGAPAECLVAHTELHVTGVSGIGGFLRHLFDTTGFPPRWHCGNWQVELGWLHILSDVAIFVAYAAIPAALAIFILRRRDVPLHTILWLFVAFILSCGITHLADATMFYYPAYRFLGLLKLITAVISLATALTLARVMPAALELPALARAHLSSQLALSESQDKEAKLQVARENLETRSAHLTVSERRLRTSMQFAGAAAISWQVDTGRFVWEAGFRDLLSADEADPRGELNWARLLDERSRAQLASAAAHAASGNGLMSIELPVAASAERSGTVRIRARAQARADDEPLVLTGLVELTEER